MLDHHLRRRTLAVAAAGLLLAPALAVAQASPAPPPPTTPAVGDMAPDFTLPAATRYGMLAAPVKLSELRGRTVVLSFFPKARTKG